MGFDTLTPQPPRTAENSRFPEAATRYGETALARSRAAAEAMQTVMDVPFGDHPDQRLDVYLPDDAPPGGAPVLVFFHGGAWAHGYKEWNGFMAPAFADLPAIFVSAGYRLVPEHRWPAQIEDAFAALAWVVRHIAEHGGDAGRIHVAGWSAGGTLASLLALRRDLYPRFALSPGIVRSCMATSTAFAVKADDPAPGTRGTTYREFLLPRAGDDIAASPLHHATGNRVPFFIAHGGNDFAHVMATAPEMATALQRAGGDVVHRVYPDADHYAMNLSQGDPQHDWVRTARAWLARR